MEQNAFLEEIEKILSHAHEKDITLRLLGANAIRIHSQTAKSMAANRPLTDLDFVGYRKERKKIEELFDGLGYQPSQTFNMIHGNERLMFFGRDGQLKVDIWLEVFRMAHTFNFGDRLKLDTPTLPLSDLLITKLQIVELNEKDVKDVVCLLMDHDLSENDADRERINVARLVGECAENWGIYKTFTTNLSKIRELATNYLSNADSTQRVERKINQILDRIEAAHKTMAWKLRARIGERRPWYETPDVR
jgi:methyl-accepting chemotaxis protein